MNRDHVAGPESSATADGDAIYDFGANNGDDIEYYLKKGMKVVGVEANPALVERCAARFHEAIDAGRLVLLNCALAPIDSPGKILFYVHKDNDVLSRIAPPPDASAAQFEPIEIRSACASQIIAEHGDPHYVKIDLEGFDQEVLRDIFANGIFPKFISSEAHSIEVFCMLVAAGYRSFNLVNGASVSDEYGVARISTASGIEGYAFPFHSAGPFGDDIKGPWRDMDSFFRFLAAEGLGWKDIHATNAIEPVHLPVGSTMTLGGHLRDLAPSVVRSLSFRWNHAKKAATRKA